MFSLRAYCRAVDGISCIRPDGVRGRPDVGHERRLLRHERGDQVRIEVALGASTCGSDPSSRAGR